MLDNDHPAQFLTAQEIASRLHVSIFTVRRWITERYLPAYKVGRGWRISQDDFDTWLRTRKTAKRDG